MLVLVSCNNSGWVLGDYEGEEVLVHGGDTFTTHTFMTLSRDRGYGIYLSSTGGSKGKHSTFILLYFITSYLFELL